MQGRVPEGADDDELVALPLAGLGELDIEGFPGRGDHVAVREAHLAGEGSGDVGHDGDPVTASELDRVGGVDADVGKHPDELLHRCTVRVPSVDRVGAAGDMGDHVRVVDGLERFPVARVEEIVALRHQREQALGAARVLGGGGHRSSFGVDYDLGVDYND